LQLELYSLLTHILATPHQKKKDQVGMIILLLLIYLTCPQDLTQISLTGPINLHHSLLQWMADFYYSTVVHGTQTTDHIEHYEAQ